MFEGCFEVEFNVELAKGQSSLTIHVRCLRHVMKKREGEGEGSTHFAHATALLQESRASVGGVLVWSTL